MGTVTFELQATTPPASLSHKSRSAEIVELVNYLNVIGEVSGDRQIINVGDTTPDADHQAYPWLELDGSGDIVGLKTYVGGVWRGLLLRGASGTRAAIEAAHPSALIGCIFESSTGEVYHKVADAGAATDWELVLTGPFDSKPAFLTELFTMVFEGTGVTRAAVEAAHPTAPIGSIYLSDGNGGASAGRMYVKVADAGAATDWEKVTTTAAD